MVLIQSPIVRSKPKQSFKSFPHFITHDFDNWQNATAVTDFSAGKSFTFREFREKCCSAAWAWKCQFGLEKGDVLGAVAENRAELAAAFLGAMAVGGVYTGCNPVNTPDEIGHQFSDANVRYLVTTTALYPKIATAMASNSLKSDQIRYIFILDMPNFRHTPNSDPRLVSIDMLWQQSHHEFPVVALNVSEDVAFLPYTSGTTGRPKGAMISHQGLVTWTVCGSRLPLRHRDTVVTVLPFFHVSGFMSFLRPLVTGAHVVLMSRFDVRNYCKVVAKYRVTILMVVPSVLLSLVRDPAVADVILDSVHSIEVGSAPTAQELLNALTARIPNLRTLSHLYGMTESGLVSSMPPLNTDKTPLLSCGLLVDGVIGKFMSVESPHRELDVGETGELWVRGGAFMKGYLNRPEETRALIDQNGWLHTGDIGHCDAAGFIYISDRLKELIKYKGYQATSVIKVVVLFGKVRIVYQSTKRFLRLEEADDVSPAEVEDVILKHSAVQEVGVTGLSNPDTSDVGELATAFVILKQGYKDTETISEEIKAIVAQHLAPYKHLRGGVVFVSELPKTGSGKILRRLLKDSRIMRKYSKL